MPLRIGFDMDGVLADFESAYREIETRLFGPGVAARADDPEREEDAEAQAEESRQEPGAAVSPGPREVPSASIDPGEPDTATDRAVTLKPGTTTEKEEPPAKSDEGRPAQAPTARQLQKRRDAIWAAIRTTPDFWRTLKPTDAGAVARIHELMLQHGWEVFFITQRPATQGETVQRQTQRWLVEQGFDLPSVIVLGGSRGAAAAALRLDYHVDDCAQHCIDIIADSRARPILILPEHDSDPIANAKNLGISTAASISECLDVLEQASIARAQPGVLGRLATLIRWK